MAYMTCTPLRHEPIDFHGQPVEIDETGVHIHTGQFYLSLTLDEWRDLVARVEEEIARQRDAA
jgi:hypothetical protein